MGRKIFISYARENLAVVQRLADSLKKRDYDVWFDQTIQSGEIWRSIIDTAIHDCTDIIVVMSSESAGSSWVSLEVGIAVGKNKTVHPVIIQDFSRMEYPSWISDYQAVDFHNTDFDVAFEKLCCSLGKPDPTQEFLDDRLKAYERTRALMSEDDLQRVNQNRKNLCISSEAEALIKRSELYLHRHRRYFFYRIVAGGVTGGLWFMLVFAILLGIKQNPNTYERILLMLIGFLPGAGAGSFFILFRETVYKNIKSKSNSNQMLLSGLGGISSFGLLMVLFVIFTARTISHEQNQWQILFGGVIAIVFGFINGIGLHLIVLKSTKAWIPTLGTIIVSALILVGFGMSINMITLPNIPWFLLVLGGFLPLMLFFTSTYKGVA